MNDQNLWDTQKQALLIEKLQLCIHSLMKEEGNAKITIQLNKLENDQNNGPKVGKRKEIIKYCSNLEDETMQLIAQFN